jgi:hypothetical protein
MAPTDITSQSERRRSPWTNKNTKENCFSNCTGPQEYIYLKTRNVNYKQKGGPLLHLLLPVYLHTIVVDDVGMVDGLEDTQLVSHAPDEMVRMV